MNSEKDYALVTGASMGIGKEIAKELSRRNINTLLIALDTPDLSELENSISTDYTTKVHSFGVDLTEPSACQHVYDWCKKNKYNVTILINNAGFGDGGYFESIPLERYCKMIDLNNKAYISLIHHFLPDMKLLNQSYIMNTSSMEATLPLPYKAVYTGTKNFIYAYSLALNEEVRSFGVKVSVLCPGGVITNESCANRAKSQGAKAKLLLLSSEQVAKIAVKNMFRGFAVIRPGKMNFLISNFAKFVPLKIKMRLLERIFRVYT